MRSSSIGQYPLIWVGAMDEYDVPSTLLFPSITRIIHSLKASQISCGTALNRGLRLAGSRVLTTCPSTMNPDCAACSISTALRQSRAYWSNESIFQYIFPVFLMLYDFFWPRDLLNGTLSRHWPRASFAKWHYPARLLTSSQSQR